MILFIKIIKKLLPVLFLGAIGVCIYFICMSGYGTKANEDAFIALSFMALGFGITFGSVLKSMFVSMGAYAKSKSKEWKKEIDAELEKKKAKELAKNKTSIVKSTTEEKKDDNNNIQVTKQEPSNTGS